ncbi:MAG: YicC family protein [Ruminococcaceae bacterium]|nr:YicC family protein [Oscillospiraceae bacterium]
MMNTIKSMTGYGRYESIDAQKKIVIDLRSVNHRYCDINIKVSRMYSYLEDKIKDYVGKRVHRGKIDVSVYFESYESQKKAVSLDEGLLQNYYEVLRDIQRSCNLGGEIGLSDLTRFSDIFIVRQEEEDQEAVWSMVSGCLEKAVDDFEAMREREGARMANDLRMRAQNVLTELSRVEELAAQAANQYADRLRERMRELLGDTPVDESRFLTEVALMADKLCVSEETVRLRSHFVEMENILKETGGIGRKLDFLVQEMNREINTIGSKANDLTVAKCVVNMKAEIEKLREQIQNIE